MVATLFTSLNTNPEHTKLPSAPVHREQPVLIVVTKTMSIFKEIAQLFVNDTPVIEALSTALKHAVVNLQNEFLPVLPMVCAMIVEILQSKCVPPLLELTKTCVLMFYREKKCTIMMQQLHVEVSVVMLTLMDATPTVQLSEFTDMIEVFFSFNANLTKKIPDAYRNPAIDNGKLLTHGN